MSTETKKAELDLSKHPFLTVKKQAIETKEKMIRLLNNRKEMIQSKKKNQTGYDLNESEILLIKTDDELSKIHTGLIQYKQQYEGLVISCQLTTEEMEDKFQSLVDEASEKRKYSKEIDEVFSNVNFDEMAMDYDKKISFYFKLKAMLYPEQEKVDKPLEIVK
jgi:anion-transporting  ArsA/GET3 family ATPase